MNRNLFLEINLDDTKSSSCVAIDSARLRPEQEAWHHPRWFGTESCRVIICLCSITLGFCKPPLQPPFGDGRWVIDSIAKFRKSVFLDCISSYSRNRVFCIAKNPLSLFVHFSNDVKITVIVYEFNNIKPVFSN